MFVTKLTFNDMIFLESEQQSKNFNLADNESNSLFLSKDNDTKKKKKNSKVSEKQTLEETKNIQELNDSVEVLSVNKILSFFNPE